jgi:hypothetical protein
MFIHHVFFWLKNPENKEDYNKLNEGLQTLLTIEPKVLGHVGGPSTTNRGVIDTSYNFSLLLIFNNLQEQEDYQVHPVHRQFVSNCSPLWEKVIVYDSE